MFIRVTDADSNIKYRVNVNSIKTYGCRQDRITTSFLVYGSGATDYCKVKETPEELDMMIEEAMSANRLISF